jgi:site-specific recombinase XerD
MTPHDLRRTFISNLLDAGVDLSTSSELAGHRDPRTTKRYDRRGEATHKQAVDKLHVPYVPRKQR